MLFDLIEESSFAAGYFEDLQWVKMQRTIVYVVLGLIWYTHAVIISLKAQDISQKYE